MKKNLYILIIIIIFVLVLGYGVVTQIQYNSLKQDYNELKFQKENTIDSLKRDNVKRLESIAELESEISILNNKIDSMYNVKQTVIQMKNEFTVSQNISEGANLLKQNLNEKTTIHTSN